MRKTILAALAALMIPQYAGADGFSSQDLGSIVDDPACLSKGRSTFETYRNEAGAGTIEAGVWSVAVFEIKNSKFDAIITCAYGPDDMTRATLVVYGHPGTEEGTRVGVAQRIKDIWDSK